MAGDWIKMRSNLWDDPRVSRLCDITGHDEAAIVGALYWLWATADQHSEDGVLQGLTVRQVDRKTHVKGFGAAMCEIGWLADHPEGVRIVRFEEHNGTSAKRRCSESRRKMSARDADTLRTHCVQGADENQNDCGSDAHLEKEKSREESTSSLRSDVVAPHADDEPQRKTSGAPKRATQLPNDFEPDETAARVAAELGVSVSRELPKFRDYHAAKGKPMKDWQAAFRTWLRNAKEYARPAAKQTDRQRQIEWLADLTGRTADAIDAPARLVG